MSSGDLGNKVVSQNRPNQNEPNTAGVPLSCSTMSSTKELASNIFRVLVQVHLIKALLADRDGCDITLCRHIQEEPSFC